MTTQEKITKTTRLLGKHVGVKVNDHNISGKEIVIDFNCTSKRSLVLIVSCVNSLPMTVSMYALPDDQDVDYYMSFEEEYIDYLIDALEMTFRYRPEVDATIIN